MTHLRPRGPVRALIRTTAAVLAAAVVVASGAATPAGAAGNVVARDPERPVSWAVRPASVPGQEQRPNFVVEADPGDTIRDGIVVENLGEVDLVLGVYASDAFNTQEGGIDLLASAEDAVDVGRWVTPEQAGITVAAGQTVEVPFTIQVPEDAAAGDHVGGIVTSLTITEPDADGNRVRVERRLGSRLYLRVSGELRPELTFTTLEADYQANANPLAPGSMTVTYAVENTGNIRLRSTREARVQGGLGTSQRVAEAADMPELLPGNSYEFTQEVKGVWPAFGTTVEVELRPYEPTGAQIDPAPRAVVGRTSRTLVPLSQIVLLTVLVLAGLFVWWSRKRRRKELDEAVGRAVSEAVRAVQGGAPDVGAPGGATPTGVAPPPPPPPTAPAPPGQSPPTQGPPTPWGQPPTYRPPEGVAVAVDPWGTAPAGGLTDDAGNADH